MHRLNENVKNKLFKEALNYSEEELNLFQAELGWEDWMNEFTDAEDGEEITELESIEIDKISEEIFNKAHSSPRFTKTWKVYGMFDGEIQHRQKESFRPSCIHNFSKFEDIRIIEVRNSDITGTNDYTIIEITRNTELECDAELDGQLSDGVFENVRTGKVERI